MKTVGSSKSGVEEVSPASIAAEKRNGLNAEPACRRAWTARSNSLRSKSYPPTRARTSPVEGSRATRAPSTVGQGGTSA
jgi:hypothetical protein